MRYSNTHTSFEKVFKIRDRRLVQELQAVELTTAHQRARWSTALREAQNEKGVNGAGRNPRGRVLIHGLSTVILLSSPSREKALYNINRKMCTGSRELTSYGLAVSDPSHITQIQVALPAANLALSPATIPTTP
uniref:Uncharacterized protein n=1 Tax=Coccidioides posadasii RMSCC 3488 TaxID=454284 RepID=A0A0J6F6E2_COCPO|nr:hypothetical protein CPAG_04833 [Coccidioides posadasii RMSCC 3488]